MLQYFTQHIFHIADIFHDFPWKICHLGLVISQHRRRKFKCKIIKIMIFKNMFE